MMPNAVGAMPPPTATVLAIGGTAWLGGPTRPYICGAGVDPDGIRPYIGSCGRGVDGDGAYGAGVAESPGAAGTTYPGTPDGAAGRSRDRRAIHSAAPIAANPTTISPAASPAPVPACFSLPSFWAWCDSRIRFGASECAGNAA